MLKSNRILSKELSSRDIETVLSRLGIEQTGSGWRTIKSPLRDEKNASFGINLDTGAFKDHATDDTGDIVTLAERMLDKDNTQAIAWIREQANLNGELQRPAKRQPKPTKALEPFWTDNARQLMLNGQKKLTAEHKLVKTAQSYDCLNIETLEYFGAAIVQKYGKNWLALPYDTGCQLYRRENNEKDIRCIPGSSPGESFFGSRKIKGDQKRLLIAKSPRECMLLTQLFNDSADVVGLATGEQGNMSTKQFQALRTQISDSNYENITTILDCDSEAAEITATSFANEIQKAADGLDVSYVNLFEATGEKYKDVTDAVQNDMAAEKLWTMITEENHRLERIEPTNQSKQTKRGLHVQAEDLRLSDNLISKLPPTVKNYLNYASPLSDVPDEFLLTPFLATAAAAIGKTRYVEVGGMQIYPTIWTVLFAGSSTERKTTAINLSQQPFKKTQERYKVQYESELADWTRRKKIAEENDEEFEEEPPQKRTIYNADGFSDLTFWQELSTNGSLISKVSEFTALWSELTRPRNSMKDLALSIFDAEDSIRRVTRSGGDIELNNPVWCLAGATTLSSFQRALSSTERGSGLLQRILPVCVENGTKEFKALTELPRPNADLYHRLNDQMLNVNALEPKAVTIGTDAEKLFTKWSHDLHNRAEKLVNRLADIGGYVSRLNVYGLKFALIFQQLQYPEQPISKDNMQAAIALAEWLFSHQIYMLDKNYIFNRMYADRLKIRELIERQDNQTMSRTDLMNMSHFDKEQLDRTLASEMDAGIIEEDKTDTGGVRPKVKYTLARAEGA